MTSEVKTIDVGPNRQCVLLSSRFDARTIRQVAHARVRRMRYAIAGRCDDGRLRLLDDAVTGGLLDNGTVEQETTDCRMSHAEPPPELSSSDPEVLRAALTREHEARLRADCLAAMQGEVIQLALDLLVREPNIEGFFGGLTKAMVEDTDSEGCAVWLLDDDRTRCDLWMAYHGNRLYTRRELDDLKFPHETFARHLMAFSEGWTQTVEYVDDDPRLPDDVREIHRVKGVKGMVVTPLVLGTTNLGWIKLSARTLPDCAGAQWWRVVLIEA